MLKRLNNKKAQAVAAEYVLVIFIVTSAIGIMGVYFRRAFQGRYYDARNYVVNMVLARSGPINIVNGISNSIAYYEPYYINQESTVTRATKYTSTLTKGGTGTTGIFRKHIDETTEIDMMKVTAPPKDAN